MTAPRVAMPPSIARFRPRVEASRIPLWATPPLLLLSLSVPVPESPVMAQALPAARLLANGDLTYEGAFRLPHLEGDTTQTFRYGASVLAYDPWRQSIWAVGHDQHQRIAEIAIPDPRRTAVLDELPTATIRTPWFDTTWRAKIGGRTRKVGGILPQSNGDLVISVYDFYDTVGIRVSHFRRTAEGTVTGPVRVHADAPGGGFAAGYMLWVPDEWRPLLGFPALTGQCCLSIINRTSFGPSLIGFDPSDVSRRDPVPGRWLLGYPNTHPRLGTTAEGVLFNGSVVNNFAGMAWVHGTRTLLAVQKIGTGKVVYAGGYSAPPNVLMALTYDAADLVAVRRGRKRPWDVVPYAHWLLSVPLGSVETQTDQQSLTHDPATGRLFLSIHTGIPGGEHIVLVYRTTDGAVSGSGNAERTPITTARRF